MERTLLISLDTRLPRCILTVTLERFRFSQTECVRNGEEAGEEEGFRKTQEEGGQEDVGDKEDGKEKDQGAEGRGPYENGSANVRVLARADTLEGSPAQSL